MATQFGFQFYNDDGADGTALAAEDTHISVSEGVVRLRIGVSQPLTGTVVKTSDGKIVKTSDGKIVRVV